MRLIHADIAELAEETVKSLPNHDKEDVRRLIELLTHFDPAFYLPNELFLSVLSYLSPKDLLTASTISRAWRLRARDEKLWRGCFAREGWKLDKEKMKSFERTAERRGRKFAEGMVRRPGGGAGLCLERRGSKRTRAEAFSDGENGADLPNLDGTADEPRSDEEDDDSSNSGSMEGVEATSSAAAASSTHRLAADATINNNNNTTSHAYSSDSTSATSPTMPSSPADVELSPALWQPLTTTSHPKLSWPYLYKHRRRLETNWEKGLYKMFQLPHPDHPEEGHEECVYTIQHTSQHLVSGSRDRTIRIWDLQTYRLVGVPLRGHDASVLCLQFDSRPEHDIIVSGGSDSYVIVWKFSTGEVLKKMTAAHDESVLNLRFDDRYIVTCSKDKTIKIWSRHELTHDSPLIPTHVLPKFNDPSDPCAGSLIPEYSLLATLSGHHAAVNAVMIHGRIIVSASGDRTIKAWDLHTGKLSKNYLGHTKGIACVQFDGRRIVSGSSDNTVRIFDAQQQAEVACLGGHDNLVRTVQARFGDLDIVSDEELEAEAKAADLGFLRAKEEGMQTVPASSRRGISQRNAGSSRPAEMMSLGTKVPPGGGGSRWAKIVSGSYDETVILWKRDAEGKWVPKQRLHQDFLLRGGRGAAGARAGGNRRHLPASALPQPANLNVISAQAGGAAGPSTGAAGANAAGGLGGGNTQHLQQILAQAQGHLQQANSLLQHPAAGVGQQQGSLSPNNQQAAMSAAQGHIGQQLNALQQQNQNGGNNNANANGNQQGAGGQQNQAANNAAAAHANAALGHHQHQHGSPPPRPESNRVFKLQFDARRITCCSQNKVVVGWDFANGETDLERVGEWSLETA